MNTVERARSRAAVYVAALGIACAFSGSCVKAFSEPLLLPVEKLSAADAIVVLGFGPPVDEKGKPNPEIVRRVEKGALLFKAGLAPLLIMTGGNTYKDYYESSVMAEVAVSLGVPGDRVLEERQAMDTIGNARYSSRIMRERGLSSCIIVSSPYHLKRAKKLFEAAGLIVQTAPAEAPDSAGYALAASTYEYLVRVQYAFIDEEALVREEAGDRHTDRIRGPVRARAEATP